MIQNQLGMYIYIYKTCIICTENMQHNCAYIYMYTSMLISGRREETYSHQFISSGRMELT